MNVIPESHGDLLESEFATLATVGPDGRPQLSEVWFLYEQGAVFVSLNSGRQKTKNLTRTKACSLLILDLANPYRYIELRGDAEISADTEYSFADRVGAKYGVDLRVHDRPGESRVVVRIRPTRVNAVSMR